MVQTVDGVRAQAVLPGAERIGTGELLQRRIDRAGTAQQQAGRAGARPAADLPLFGDRRQQGSLFDAAQAYDLIVRQQVIVSETGERLQMERPAAAALAETEAAVQRHKALLACLRR